MNSRYPILLAATTAICLGFGPANAATYNMTYSVVAPPETVEASGTLTTNDSNDTIIGLAFGAFPSPFPSMPYIDLSDLATVPTGFDDDDIWVPISNTEGSFWMRFRTLDNDVFSGTFTLYAGNSLDLAKPWAWGSFTSEMVAPVPVPAAFPMLVGAVAALRVATRRRRK